MKIKQILPIGIPLEKVADLHANIQISLPNYKVITEFKIN